MLTGMILFMDYCSFKKGEEIQILGDAEDPVRGEVAYPSTDTVHYCYQVVVSF